MAQPVLSQRKVRARVPKGIWFAVPFLLSAAVLFGARAVPGAVEQYARAVYPVWAGWGSRLSARASFSLSELLAMCLGWAAAISLGAALWRRLFAREKARWAVLQWAKRWVGTAGVLLLVFTLSFGVLYARPALEQTQHWTVVPRSASSLDTLVGRLIRVANGAVTGESAEKDVAAVLDRVPDVYAHAAANHDFLSSVAWGAPKVARASGLFSALLVEGVYSPFTMEAHVNANMPAYAVPFIACHEAAHQRGFAHEADADVAAFLACMDSGDDMFRYSAAMGALQYALPALAKADGGRYAWRMAQISGAVMEDLQDRAAFWNPLRGRFPGSLMARVMEEGIAGLFWNAASGQEAGEDVGFSMPLPGAGQGFVLSGGTDAANSRSMLYGGLVDLLLAMDWGA